MQISPDYLIQVCERASTISERLAGNFQPRKTPVDEAAIRSRMERWCHLVAGGNQQQFEKRLAWDNLDLERVSQVLGGVHLTDDRHLPAWTDTLRAALERTMTDAVATSEIGSAKSNRFLNPQEPLPFEELFLSFIQLAQETLKSKVGSSYYLLTESAHITLEQTLLQGITLLCSQALNVKFQVFRNDRSTLIEQIQELQGIHSKEQYNKFIGEMLAGGLLAFFQDYSVLARLVAVITDFWIDHNCELIQRLASDWVSIQTTFSDGAELGQVVAVQTHLSDMHQDGRSVVALTFTTGLKLIYKPKDLGIEAAYFQLLNWLNERQAPLPFKLLRVLNRSEYGWVEYVEHLPCADGQAAERYYQRAGMLLCLLYVLKGTDCHNENIIACGEYPVLIDMEMLLCPEVKPVGQAGIDVGALDLVVRQVSSSVLQTGFLPAWQLGPDGVMYDVSGLGGNGGQETHFRVKQWQYVNTDRMRLSYEYAKTTPQANLPSVAGVTLMPGDYIEDLVDGFRQMYHFLSSHREALLDFNSPLTVFAHQQTRFLFRPTQVYGALLKEALQPKYMRDGVDYSIALDILCKPHLKFETKPHYWSIFEAEKQVLAQLNIPLFKMHPDSDDLAISPDYVLRQYFTEPSYNLVSACLHQLSEEDLETQISFIRGSIYTRTTQKLVQSSIEQNARNSAVSLTQEALVQQAIKIAREIQRRSLRAPDGSVTWMGLEYIRDAERFQFQPMSHDLFDGTFGVALFLAALEKVTGGAGFRDLALGAVQSLCEILQNSDPEVQQYIVKQIGIGGGKGLGSIVYTLVQISQFLDEPALLEDAKRAARLITPDIIANDRKFDIIFGTAGTLLGLLALYQVTNDPEVRTQLTACGHHLLNHRSCSSQGYRAWATIDEQLLTGVSHGASGIAYSLLRLSAAIQDPLFLEAAKEAIAYEDSVFSAAAQNWPDFRNKQPAFGVSWCHGAPGIGLSRSGSLAVLNTEDIRASIETCLQTTKKIGLQDLDHLCCGNFGRMELLIEAAHQLSRPELLEIAHQQAAYVVTAAEEIGFQIFPKPFQGIYNPGFFSGTAGIGYELLRLAHPSLPSVLLWQVGNL